MGRQQDLERLALGRSAFQDIPSEGEASEQGIVNPDALSVTLQHDEEAYGQQYNSKGRPINPATEARNQSLRHAQNAVLALVGVVESKETSAQERAAQNRDLQDRLDKLLTAEDEDGELLETFASLLVISLTWWPKTLLSRIQAGVHAGADAFTDIVMSDLTTLQGAGVGQFFDILFAGLPLHILCHYLRILLPMVTEQLIGRLQGSLSRRLQPRAAKRAAQALALVFEVLVIAVDIALLPLQYHATIQRLQLAPARPILPSWKALLPTGTKSTHSFMWEPLISTAWLGWLSAPATLLFLREFLKHDRTSLLEQVNEFECPPINEAVAKVKSSDMHQGPFGRLLYHGYVLRVRVLRWFGWNLEYIKKAPLPGEEHTNNRVARTVLALYQDRLGKTNEDLQRVYRSTSLSHLPAEYLAHRIDDWYKRLLLLPWNSLILRAVTQSFLATTLTRTTLALSAAPYVYAPFGGGPFGAIRTHGFTTIAWREVGSYVSKLGLSFALHCSIEVGIFFAVYRVTRWQGIRDFEWGKAHEPHRTAIDSAGAGEVEHEQDR